MAELTKPFAKYPHTRRAGELVFVAGQGCRDPETNAYAGTVVENDKVVSYDIVEQTKGVLQNVERALKNENLTRKQIIDVNVFLMDMDILFRVASEAL